MDPARTHHRWPHAFIGMVLMGSLAAVDEADPLLPKPDPLVPKVEVAPPPTAPAPTAPVAAAKKVLLPLPDETSQSAALGTLHALYQDDYAKRRPNERVALALLLLQHGKRPQVETAQRFVALREAEELACKYGDVDTALSAAEVLCTWFVVPAHEENARVLSALTPNLSDPTAAQTAAFSMLSLIDSCIAADDYEAALRLSRDCETIARKLRDQALTTRAKTLSERSRELRDEFIKIGDTSDLLGVMTPDGHHRLGRFLCLFKNDWLPGLLHLAAGHDKEWATLARSDLTAHVSQEKAGNDGTPALTAAEAWRTQAVELARGTQRESAQTRALLWYRRAVSLLAGGAAKIKAEKRIAELERALGPAAQGSLPLYPPNPALLLTFEADTLALAGTRLTGVLDVSGSGLRFPATGATPVRGAHGIALQFDGEGQVEVGNLKHVQIIGNQTIAFWMWPAVLDTRRNPFNKSYSAEGTMTLEPSGVVNYYYGAQSTGLYDSVGMNVAVTAKTWVHLALVRDFTSKTITWYRNGKATTPVATVYPSASVSTQPLIIGNGYAGAFIGQLDDIAVWPRALSAPEIAGLYAATATGR